jgi:pantetheine-phosphate adenylyltransferase
MRRDLRLDPPGGAAYHRRMSIAGHAGTTGPTPLHPGASTAVYAGTFDPVTFGHLDIIARSAEVFSRLIVATTDNINKSELFSLDERLALLRSNIDNEPRIEVQSFEGLLVDFVRHVGAKVIVRGLRAAADFDYEFEMAMMNHSLAPDVETVFFVTSPQFMFVSSKLIREIAFRGGDISPFVPPSVRDAIISKLGRPSAGA